MRLKPAYLGHLVALHWDVLRTPVTCIFIVGGFVCVIAGISFVESKDERKCLVAVGVGALILGLIFLCI